MKAKFWIISFILLAASFALPFLPTVNQYVKELTLLPAILAIIGMLVKLFWEFIAHERSKDIQNRQNVFNLGATSHMANVVFDKHVLFCEKYLEEVHQTVVPLTRKGPCKDVLNHTGKLYSLRMEYAAWITSEIEEKLIPFEKVLREIGAMKLYLEDTADPTLVRTKEASERRQNDLKEIYQKFSELMGHDNKVIKSSDLTSDVTVLAVKERAREILQIKELVEIRSKLIKLAHGTL